MVDNPVQPTLRILRDGRVLLDDELTAPTWYQQTTTWMKEKLEFEAKRAQAMRTDRCT